LASKLASERCFIAPAEVGEPERVGDCTANAASHELHALACGGGHITITKCVNCFDAAHRNRETLQQQMRRRLKRRR
jgi:hypothetical protein